MQSKVDEEYFGEIFMSGIYYLQARHKTHPV